MVNPGIHAGVIAAAKRARGEVLGRLREQHALQSSAAVRIDDLGGTARRTLDRLVADGVVRDAGAGRYYLDEARLRAHEEQVRQKARTFMLVLLLVALVLLIALAVSLVTR